LNVRKGSVVAPLRCHLRALFVIEITKK